MTDIAAIAREMTKAQQRILLQAPSGWFPAQHLTKQLVASAGSLLATLYNKGLVARISDPHKWGRAQYELTMLGQQVRAYLTENPDAQS